MSAGREDPVATVRFGLDDVLKQGSVVRGHPYAETFEARVEVGNHASAGIMADVVLTGAKSAEQESLVTAALGKFATPFRVRWAAGS